MENVGIGRRWQPENSAISAPLATVANAGRPYNEAEYLEHFQSEQWSREETDYLFDLVSQFNARFVLVADRYNFPDTLRTVEDLRERYYQVMGKLSNLRNTPTFVYDKEGDRHRRLTLSQSKPNLEESILSEMLSDLRLSLPTIAQARQRLLLCCAGLGQQLLAHGQTLPELLGMKRRSSGDIKSSKKSAKKAAERKRRSEQKNEEIYGQALNSQSSVGKKTKPVMANTFVRSADLKVIRTGLTRQVDKSLQDKGFCTLIFTWVFICSASTTSAN